MLKCLVCYFNMEPRLKWNKTVLADKTFFISFHASRLKSNKIVLARLLFVFSKLID